MVEDKKSRRTGFQTQPGFISETAAHTIQTQIAQQKTDASLRGKGFFDSLFKQRPSDSAVTSR